MHPGAFFAVMASLAWIALTLLESVPVGHSVPEASKINWTVLGTSSFSEELNAWWGNLTKRTYIPGLYLAQGWDPGWINYQLEPPDIGENKTPFMNP